MQKIPYTEIAERILRGGSIEDKLFGATLGADEVDWSIREGQRSFHNDLEAMALPGRAGKLNPAPSGESDSFPKVSELKNTTSRGKLLHFFSNHELLAMETMAMTLLKFPDAPLEFKKGVWKTLQDEQRHFKRYQERMHDFGVEVGDFALNLYFWNTLKTIQSPLDFVTRMSLTFEQANLDFALGFAQEMEKLDDTETAHLLREVHDDELQHVKHGLHWFNAWRPANPNESEWDAYTRLLPFPMTPRRAKGKWFSEKSRMDVGFTQEYIDELKIAGGSRGRAPDLFIFNPQCEMESRSLGKNAGGPVPKSVRQKIEDLEPLLLWLTKESDVVQLTQRPDREWLKAVHDLTGELPEIMTDPEQSKRYAFFECVKPWGWSASVYDLISKLKERVRTPAPIEVETAEKILSKVWWTEQLAKREELAPFLLPKGIVRSKAELVNWIAAHSSLSKQFILKAASSTSGRGHMVFDRDTVQEMNWEGDEGGRVVEPFLAKKADFSTQLEISPTGALRIFEPRAFKIDAHYQYLGASLGASVKEKLPIQVIQGCVDILRSVGYVGPVGIDSLIYEDAEGNLKTHAVVEVNARMTMGRVAYELESRLRKKGKPAIGEWRFYSATEMKRLGFNHFVELEADLKQKNPGKVISTTPPGSSENTWTVIVLD